jgi:hypothetical protein
MADCWPYAAAREQFHAHLHKEEYSYLSKSIGENYK